MKTMYTQFAAAPDAQWYDNVTAGGHQGVIYAGNMGIPVALTYNPVDAALIVRAVNSHSDLIAALDATLALLTNGDAEPCDADRVTAIIRAALAKART